MEDELHNPQPHQAPPKATVSAVLSSLASAGGSLISLLSGLLAAVLILYSGYVLYDTFYTQNQAYSGAWEALQYKPELLEDGVEPQAGLSELAAINQDYRAWLTMYETNIDYPLMQGADDLFYASHDVYGQSSLTGSVYLAAGNTPDLTDAYNLIYGHHMDNGAMFGALDSYLDPAYLEAHREGLLVTEKGVYDLTVFAVIETNAYQSLVYSVGPSRTAAEVLEFLTNPPDDTVVRYYDAEAAVGAQKLTAMSTCANAVTNGRLVVFCVTTQRNLIEVQIPSYEGVYDAKVHGVSAVTNYPEGTSILYSLDGGATWSEEPPQIRDVGTLEVLVRATNAWYGTATASATLTVLPAPVVVRAAPSGKVYGAADPDFYADVTGVIDGYEIGYTLRRVGGQEDAGSYEDAIVPEGAAQQGNYTVTYIPADFTITPGTMDVFSDGYDDVYDTETHTITATPSVTEGTTVWYSTDGGKTWTEEPPEICDAESFTVLIRAENPNYETVQIEVTMKVTHRPAVVTANEASKPFGTEDPEFSAVVTGLIDDTVLVYTVNRPGAGTDEDVGVYENAIVPTGAAVQGNYTVSYVPARFEITGETIPVDPEPVDEPPIRTDGEPPAGENHSPLLGPRGQSGAVWALLNLICVILTVYILAPLRHWKDKFRRGSLMRRFNKAEEELLSEESADAPMEAEAQEGAPLYEVRRFSRRMKLSLTEELISAIAAVLLFLLTEDMRLPMVLIDRWTPIMLLILGITWVTDVRLARYRKKRNAEETAQADKPVAVG